MNMDNVKKFLVGSIFGAFIASAVASGVFDEAGHASLTWNSTPVMEEVSE